ncbi:hypothetical protein THRCLA_21440, partial [Thraustotheca clavata]
LTGAAQVAASDVVQQLFDLHNQERQKNGIAPFTCLDSQLSQLSADHVKYEVQIDNINHDGFSERCDAVGQVACGENTLYDYVEDAAKFTQSWMNSSGHRKNILNGDYTHVGFAVQKGPSGKWFATALFTSDNPHPNTCGTSTPAPTNNPSPTSAPTTANPLPTGPPDSTTIKPTRRPAPKTPTPIPYTKKPTTKPTVQPTSAPTDEPSDDPTDAPSNEPTDAPEPSSVDAVIKQLYDAHNAARQQNGVKPFTCLDSKLSSLSLDHVNYEIKVGNINHDGFQDRCRAAGNSGGCGENTLYDYEGNAQKMTTSWMNSSGHRANILNSAYNHVGFGVKKASDGRYYATAVKYPEPNYSIKGHTKTKEPSETPKASLESSTTQKPSSGSSATQKTNLESSATQKPSSGSSAWQSPPNSANTASGASSPNSTAIIVTIVVIVVVLVAVSVFCCCRKKKSMFEEVERMDCDYSHVQEQPRFNDSVPIKSEQLAPWHTNQYKLTESRSSTSTCRSSGMGTLTNGSSNSQRMSARRPDPNFSKIDMLDSPYIVRFKGASWTAPADIVLVTEFIDAWDLRTVLDNNSTRLYTWQHKVSCALALATTTLAKLFDPCTSDNDCGSTELFCIQPTGPTWGKCGLKHVAKSGELSRSQNMGAQFASAEDIVQQLFDLHNAAREENGVESYTCLDSTLSSLSMDHVNYEIEIGDINHDGFGERCEAAGNPGFCAENTLYVYEKSAALMTKNWMNSPGHRKNILNPSINHAGFAVKMASDGRYYATAMFTQDSGECPP